MEIKFTAIEEAKWTKLMENLKTSASFSITDAIVREMKMMVCDKIENVSELLELNK